MAIPVFVDDLLRNNSNRYRWLRWILLFILLLFIVLVIIFFAVLWPKTPNFSVKSLSLTNFTSTGTVSGTWQVVFLVKNPNLIFDINYRSLQSFIYHENMILAESYIMPYRQHSKSEITQNVRLSAVDVKVDVSDINKEREQGFVRFNLQLDGHVIIKYSKMHVRVLCTNLVVGISSNSLSGELKAGANKCYFN